MEPTIAMHNSYENPLTTLQAYFMLLVSRLVNASLFACANFVPKHIDLSQNVVDNSIVKEKFPQL